MRVSYEGGIFRGSHVTGPTHNYLSMRVSQAPTTADFEVLVLPAIGTCQHHAGLEAEEVHKWIAEGVARANEELGTAYGVRFAEVVENDSRRPEVYIELSRRIVLAANERDASSA